MPQAPAPTRGRRNCSRCTRWRPVIDFPVGRRRLADGTPLDPPQLSSWCEVCRRRSARTRAELVYRGSGVPYDARTAPGPSSSARSRREKLRRELNEEAARERSAAEVRRRFAAKRATAADVANGEALPATREFRLWLAAKLAEHGVDLLREWAGVGPRELYSWRQESRAVLPIDPVDRLILWEGTRRLEDFWPLGG